MPPSPLKLEDTKKGLSPLSPLCLEAAKANKRSLSSPLKLEDTTDATNAEIIARPKAQLVLEQDGGDRLDRDRSASGSPKALGGVGGASGVGLQWRL